MDRLSERMRSRQAEEEANQGVGSDSEELKTEVDSFGTLRSDRDIIPKLTKETDPVTDQKTENV